MRVLIIKEITISIREYISSEWDLIIIPNHLRVPIEMSDYLKTRLNRRNPNSQIIWVEPLQIIERRKN